MHRDWIEWAPKLGTLARGPADDVALVRLRSGRELRACAQVAWTHVGSSNDVVAYLPTGAA